MSLVSAEFRSEGDSNGFLVFFLQIRYDCAEYRQLFDGNFAGFDR